MAFEKRALSLGCYVTVAWVLFLLELKVQIFLTLILDQCVKISLCRDRVEQAI